MNSIDLTFGLFLAIAIVVCCAWIYGTTQDGDE